MLLNKQLIQDKQQLKNRCTIYIYVGYNKPISSLHFVCWHCTQVIVLGLVIMFKGFNSSFNDPSPTSLFLAPVSTMISFSGDIVLRECKSWREFLALSSSHGNLRLGAPSFPASRFPQIDRWSWKRGSTFNGVSLGWGRAGKKLSTTRTLRKCSRRGTAFFFWKEKVKPCVRCEFYDTSSNLAWRFFRRRTSQ